MPFFTAAMLFLPAMHKHPNFSTNPHQHLLFSVFCVCHPNGCELAALPLSISSSSVLPDALRYPPFPVPGHNQMHTHWPVLFLRKRTELSYLDQSSHKAGS